MARNPASDVETRRIARAAWPVVVRALENSTNDDLSSVTDPAQRIRMMWPLAVEAWRLAGIPLLPIRVPTCPRACSALASRVRATMTIDSLNDDFRDLLLALVGPKISPTLHG